jgi:PAS domain S-box-containing protein/putative nucleotidyltransferase with HDIG domain
MAGSLKILLVEDRDCDAEMTRIALKRQGLEVSLDRASCRGEVEARIETGDFDLAILDFSIPGIEGFDLIRLVRGRFPGLPILVFTGALDEERAADCIHEGADRFVLKEHPGRLAEAIRGSLERREMVEKAKRAEEALQRERAYLDMLFELAPDALVVTDHENVVTRVNRGFLKTFGTSRQDCLGRDLDSIVASGSCLAEANGISRRTLAGEPSELETFRSRASGDRFPCRVVTVPLSFSDGTKGAYTLYHDLTEERLRDGQLRQVNQRLLEHVKKLEKAWAQTVEVLAVTTEAKDPYTAGHQRKVARLAREIALELGLGQEKVEEVAMAALVHDIGKIEVPAEILSKPGRLSGLEYRLIQEHSKIGYRILKSIESPWDLAEIVYQHHERLDGSGYPRGLKGEEILLEARILAVADTVEAMASHRPYRPSRGIGVALDEIKEQSGITFDRQVVEACLRVFSKVPGLLG